MQGARGKKKKKSVLHTAEGLQQINKKLSATEQRVQGMLSPSASSPLERAGAVIATNAMRNETILC